MGKRFLLWFVVTLVFLFGESWATSLSNLKTFWSLLSPLLFFGFIWIYVKICKKIFNEFFHWLAETAYDRHISLKETKMKVKNTLPPPAPKPQNKGTFN